LKVRVSEETGREEKRGRREKRRGRAHGAQRHIRDGHERPETTGGESKFN
jgi:hypothetical protein